MEENVDKNLVQTLNQNFGLKMRKKIMPEAELLEKLSFAVAYLLQNNTQKLFGLLYRHDVNEKLLRQALLAEDSRQIAENIAKLVLEREKQKIEMRKKYSNQ